jgi:Fe2+ or Zn2+ uptake regulation protein
MNKKPSSILQSLSALGSRLTPARIEMAAIFDAQSCRPVTATEVIQLLSKKDINVNKTTVYRELDFLKSQGLVREINVMGSSARYELSERHHHHLICTSCDKWLPIDIDESFMKGVKQSVKRHKALLTDHLLEFFGVCSSCRKTS